ncbi:hypothetical protein [Rhizobium sp. VS19-DR183]|uniref:hypothetical protein n=1 Tax=Rhizobium sp. VS19-DR183 TaxID=2875958 RepID=UPI001CCACDC4|nr:hypothetical protein [Rhizobium sp. VS19-DR183]MBZ5762219.1 hypothetical protein [Rhizobium sp. VS19-DR96]
MAMTRAEEVANRIVPKAGVHRRSLANDDEVQEPVEKANAFIKPVEIVEQRGSR